jgi:hypothetical protein
MSENIVRVKKDERYFVASNVPFNDTRLSWEARGVMGYLLSKPDQWHVRMTDLVNQGPAGIKVIRRVLAELRKYGYMSRECIKDDQGHFSWVTTLYESPELNRPYSPNGNTVTEAPSELDIVSTESSTENTAKVQKIVQEANQTVDYLLDNARKAEIVWPGREKIPAQLWPLADEFVTLTGLKPAKKELVWWMGDWDTWKTLGACTADVREAWEYARAHNYDIFTPGSMTKTIRMLLAKHSTQNMMAGGPHKL